MFKLQGYTVSEPLSQGVHFNVLRGTQLDTQQAVVLKFCREEQPSPEEIRTLTHEYQLLKQLNLPHIIKTYGLIKHHHQLILVLEDIQGYDLHKYLAEHSLSLTNFFTIAIQLAEALQELQTYNFIHKDINPGNIIIEPGTLTTKLIDFSIATQLTQEVSALTPEHLEGTLAYLAPEQTGRMNAKVDYRADFYSLGVTFYEMLTNTLPFQADDPLELIYSHLAKIAPPVNQRNPQIPDMVAAIIAKLMAKLPEERYSSAAGLKADLMECQRQWLSQQTITPFTLGQHDFSERLILSQKLYGRETEVQLLLAAFERVNQENGVTRGKAEIVLVSGYSGIGKTSLIKELYKPITRRHGYFISGKYDQLQHTTPFSAFIEAFQDLTHRLLAEPPEKLLQLKNNLLTALGSNAQVLIDVIPNLALLLGEQPPIPELPPEQTQNRFMLTFQAFICALAQPAHPLVLFLDDLQWADSASLQLLNQIMLTPELQHFLLLGAYRNNEVSDEHPLSFTIQTLQKAEVPLSLLVLTPLTQTAICQLLADSLNCPFEQAAPLATLIFDKTQGNPFFINEFIKLLYHQHLLQFSQAKHQWDWDITQIQAQAVTDNVVDLLAARLQELPETVQKILSLAACTGHIFDLQTLAIISEQTRINTAHQLWPAVTANFIKPLGSYNQITSLLEETPDETAVRASEKIQFQFIHDRIQQAAYQLISESAQQQIHLTIGRLLLKEYALQPLDPHLFAVLNHLNQSLTLIQSPTERLDIARYNLWACQKAKLATAYQIALDYAQAGISLLPENAWEQMHELSFALYREFAESTYLVNRHEDTERALQILLKQSNSPTEKMNICTFKMKILNTESKFQEAITLGLEILREMGITIRLPKKVKPWHLVFATLKLIWKLSAKNIAAMNSSVAEQQENLKAEDLLLSQLTDSMYNVDKYQAGLITAKLTYINLKHGDMPSFIAVGSINLAIGMLHLLHRYKKALDFVALSEKFSKQLPPQSALLMKQIFCLHNYILPYQYSLAEYTEYTMKTYQECLDVGNTAYAMMSLNSHIFVALVLGKPLSEVNQLLHNTQNFQTAHKIPLLQNSVKIRIECVRFLQGERQEGLPDITEAIAQLDSKVQIGGIYSHFLMFTYFREDFEGVLKIYELLKPYLPAVLGIILHCMAQFFYAMALIACYDNASGKIQRKYLKELKALHKQLKRWAVWCPINFLPYETLIAAEQARLNQRITEAATLYDQAIEAAHTSENLYVLGMANESAARFYLTLNKPRFAKLYLQDAWYTYNQWGAVIKCKALEKSYPDWLQTATGATIKKTNTSRMLTTLTTTTTSSSSLASIDVLSILKSAQTISSEIHLEKLLQKLLCILLENAGAQRGMILMQENNNWFVKAEGTMAAQQIILTQSEPLEQRQNIPLSLLHYVQRSHTQVLIQTPEEFERYYAEDPYLEQTKPQSVLIVPVFYQSELVSLIYLENHDISCAFTPESIQTLHLLASQAAISLENARLYYQATHDTLTGLANRSLLYYLFQRAEIKAKRENTLIAILFFDLDGFKKINDTLGHEAGDKLLLYFTEQLKHAIQETDLAARLGGDEFIVMLEGLTNPAQAGDFAERFLAQLKAPATIAGQQITVASSIGISLYPQDGLDIQTLLKQADSALYQVKSAGKNNYQFYSAKTQPAAAISDEAAQVAALQQALENGEFCLHYQPVFTPAHQLTHFEALLRWQHPVHGLLPAEEFIGLAEKTGLILSIGEWMLKSACAQLKTWQSAPDTKHIPLAVNISGLQFKRQKLSLLIKQLADSMGINPAYLELEFTESVFIDYTQAIQDDMSALKALGVKFTLDDFGTYYSSFMYLKRFQIDKIKIDRSFVKEIPQNEIDKAIIQAIVLMSHSLKIPVIAEGIETKAQLQFLTAQGVDELQGFHLGKPMLIEEYQHLLKQRAKL